MCVCVGMEQHNIKRILSSGIFPALNAKLFQFKLISHNNSIKVTCNEKVCSIPGVTTKYSAQNSSLTHVEHKLQVVHTMRTVHCTYVQVLYMKKIQRGTSQMIAALFYSEENGHTPTVEPV